MSLPNAGRALAARRKGRYPRTSDRIARLAAAYALGWASHLPVDRSRWRRLWAAQVGGIDPESPGPYRRRDIAPCGETSPSPAEWQTEPGAATPVRPNTPSRAD